MSNVATRSDSPCSALDAAVQALLDGEAASLPADLEAHRNSCAACRATWQGALDLQRGLRLLTLPTIPADLTERWTTAVVNDQRVSPASGRLERRLLPWALIAASVLAAVLLLRPWSHNGPLGTTFVARPPQPPPVHIHLPDTYAKAPSLDLRSSLEEAGAAVASLTRRTADETVESTRKLFPTQVGAPSFAIADELPKALDPAAQSLEEVRQGAMAGLEPMATSARRAFSMLLQVPGSASDRKNDF